MATRLQIAKPDIVATFRQMQPVLHLSDVAQVFQEKKAFWRLAKNTTLKGFLHFMEEKTELKAVRFAFPQRPVTGYAWGDVPLLEVLLGLVDGSFYSHFTAVRLHGLTEQDPHTIFLNQEKQSQSSLYADPPEGPFDQEAIDHAFKQPPRASKNEVVHGDKRIVFLSGAYQATLGVTDARINYGEERDLHLRFTGLERTLIDIAVRPFYAGGVFEVAKAYENAQGRVQVNTMAAMLKRMQFGYPYHQAIGFYLERAGYRQSLVDLFKQQPQERDFYLAHAMGETRYVKQWRLHVPKGF